MNICIIGLGSMGKRRLRLLKQLFPNVNPFGVDSDHTKTERTEEEWGIRCYLSLNDIDVNMDCAFICTSPQSHAGIIQECLEKGMHVFSEINLINDRYDENMRLAKQKNKVLFLSSTPLYKEEMQIIGGRVKQSENPCAYQYHVGQYLPDWHPWDKLEDFFVSSKNTNGCRELFAIELPWIQHTFGKIQKIHAVKSKLLHLHLDFPDTYFVQLVHENGNIGSLSVDVVSRQAVRKLEVFNEKLYVKWDGTPDSLYEKDIVSGEMKQIAAGTYIHEQGYSASINEYAYAREIEAFLDAIHGKNPLYSFEEDKGILEIIDKIES